MRVLIPHHQFSLFHIITNLYSCLWMVPFFGTKLCSICVICDMQSLGHRSILPLALFQNSHTFRFHSLTLNHHHKLTAQHSLFAKMQYTANHLIQFMRDFCSFLVSHCVLCSTTSSSSSSLPLCWLFDDEWNWVSDGGLSDWYKNCVCHRMLLDPIGSWVCKRA